MSRYVPPNYIWILYCNIIQVGMFFGLSPESRSFLYSEYIKAMM